VAARRSFGDYFRAAAETDEPGDCMKLGISLFIVYVIGKIFAVALHGLPVNAATPFVLLWQDAVTAALVGCVAKFSRRAGWVLYVAAIAHFAISMPLLRLMATPLTAPLMWAGGGTIGDSVRHHFDVVNLSLIAWTLLLGGVLPVLMRRWKCTFGPWAFAVLSAMAIAGWVFTGMAELQGLHRNSLVAFVSSFKTSDDYAPQLAASHEPSAMRGVLSGANVLLVSLESTGARHLKTYGDTNDPMPFFTQFAREGVVFENAYAPYPESIKGLLALLASRQAKFGLEEEAFAGCSSPSLATVCARAGYETALFHSGRFMYLGMDAVVRAAGFHVAEDAGAIGGNYNSSFGVDDFSTVDRVLKWMDERSSAKSFFVHYVPIASHHPYDSPMAGPFSGSEDLTAYLNALNYSDRALQRLMDGLERRELLKNTLVVIYGDHGEAFGEHPGNFGHTLYLYEENVRVPLVVWAPGQLLPKRVERVTSLVDVAPTICDLLGLETPRTFQGVSAFSEIERAAVFVTEYSMRLFGMRFGSWKFISEVDTGFARLYDLSLDPNERRNVASLHPDLVRNFRSGVFEWSEAAKASKLGGNSTTVARR
jgi:phosphoglycerol transferase MdoB-like AlkP superfamily enzyme